MREIAACHAGSNWFGMSFPVTDAILKRLFKNLEGWVEGKKGWMGRRNGEDRKDGRGWVG